MKLTEEIFELLIEQNTIVNEYRESGLSWIGNFTKIIKRTIVELGVKKYKFYVSTNLIEIADQNEWLFDISYQEIELNGDKTMTLSIPLVVESELSKISFGGFKEDFDKLFIATSSERLFIFRKLDHQIFDEIIDYAKKSVNKFRYFKKGQGIDLIYWDEIETKEFKMLEITKTK